MLCKMEGGSGRGVAVPSFPSGKKAACFLITFQDKGCASQDAPSGAFLEAQKNISGEIK